MQSVRQSVKTLQFANLGRQLVVHAKGLITRSQRGVILWFWISSPKARPHLNPEELTEIACVGCVGLLQMEIRREEDTSE